MPTIRNDAPWGDLDVPLLRRVVASGEVVEVTDEQARRLLPQDIWGAVDDRAREIQAELDQAAEDEAAEAAGPEDEPAEPVKPRRRGKVSDDAAE